MVGWTVGDVVCAIRGGPGSYQLRLVALMHAADNDVTVHFVSIVDPVAYDPLHEGEQHAIRFEMAWRDLAMAKAAASRAGLGEVHYTVAVRVGALTDTIATFAREVVAEAILVGSPRSAADAKFVGGTDEFAAELRSVTGLTVDVMATDG